MKLAYEQIETPIGTLGLAVRDRDVCLLEFDRDRRGVEKQLARRFGEVELFDSVSPLGYTDCIRAYFQGELGALDEIAVDPGGTTFQGPGGAGARRAATAASRGRTATGARAWSGEGSAPTMGGTIGG